MLKIPAMSLIKNITFPLYNAWGCDGVIMSIDGGIKKNTENGNGRGIIIKVVGIEFTVIQKEIDHLHAVVC